MRIGTINSKFLNCVCSSSEAVHADYSQMRSLGYTAADDQHISNPENYIIKEMSDSEYEGFLREERQLAAENGIIINQVHGPWPVDDKTPEKRRKNIEHMKKCVLGAYYLGAEAMVVHPVMPFGAGAEDDAGFAENLNIETFSEVCDFALAYNVKVCVENLPFPQVSLSKTENVRALVDKINKPNIGICLDTGHAKILGLDLADAVRICGDRLVCLHVHDNNGYQEDTHMVPYLCAGGWEKFIYALKEVGYKGVLSLESGAGSMAQNAMPEHLKELFLKYEAATARYLAGLMD